MGVSKHRRDIRIEEHDIRALAITFVVLASNCACEVVLGKHVVVRISSPSLTHPSFSHAGFGLPHHDLRGQPRATVAMRSSRSSRRASHRSNGADLRSYPRMDR